MKNFNKKFYYKKNYALQAIMYDNQLVVGGWLLGKSGCLAIQLPYINDLKREFHSKLLWLADTVTGNPVYYYHSGMDCDSVQYGYPMKFENRAEADKHIYQAHQWADGPMYFTRIYKEDYDEAKSYSHDLALEAYEDGHSHVVRPHSH